MDRDSVDEHNCSGGPGETSEPRPSGKTPPKAPERYENGDEEADLSTRMQEHSTASDLDERAPRSGSPPATGSPRQSPQLNEEDLSACLAQQGSPDTCIVCGLSEELRYPLIFSCYCEKSRKMHPECTSEAEEADADLSYHDLVCEKSQEVANEPTTLVTDVFLQGRTIHYMRNFQPDDTYTDVITLHRRLRYIAPIPKLKTRDTVVTSDPEWWDAPIDFSDDRELRAELHSYCDLSVLVHYQPHDSLTSPYRPYTLATDCVMDEGRFFKHWKTILDDAIKVMSNVYHNIEFKVVESLLVQQTAKISVRDDSDRITQRYCISVYTDENRPYYEDLDSGMQVEGSVDEVVLEFLTSDVGYYLPKSSHPGLTLFTSARVLTLESDGTLKTVDRSSLNEHHFVLMLAAVTNMTHLPTTLHYCLDGDAMEDVYFLDKKITRKATPDMVRTFILISDGVKLPKLYTPPNRKLMLFKRYGHDVTVEDNIVKNHGCIKRERWGSRWLRASNCDHLHESISIGVESDPPDD